MLDDLIKKCKIKNKYHNIENRTTTHLTFRIIQSVSI
jgi:hypothetical protein